MYALEKQARQMQKGDSRYTWKRYATCGSKSLLERIRAAQRQPEDWRIVNVKHAGQTGRDEFPKAS